MPYLLFLAMTHRPDGDHDDDDGDELKQHPPPHQFLRVTRRSAPHHVDEAEQQHQRDRGYRDGNDERTKK